MKTAKRLGGEKGHPPSHKIYQQNFQLSRVQSSDSPKYENPKKGTISCKKTLNKKTLYEQLLLESYFKRRKKNKGKEKKLFRKSTFLESLASLQPTPTFLSCFYEVLLLPHHPA